MVKTNELYAQWEIKPSELGDKICCSNPNCDYFIYVGYQAVLRPAYHCPECGARMKQDDIWRRFWKFT